MAEASINARMRRKVARLGVDNARVNYTLAYGPPARSTLRHAHSLGAEVIVAGKQGRSTLAGWLLGSVSRRLMSEATCDLLIVPQPRDPAPRVVEPVALRLEPPPPLDNAALAPRATAHAGALVQRHWIHNKAGFASRRAS